LSSCKKAILYFSIVLIYIYNKLSHYKDSVVLKLVQFWLHS
jgi:hypothetical protein